MNDQRCPKCGRQHNRHTDCEHCVRVAIAAATDAARERAWRKAVLSDYGPPPPPPPPREEWTPPESPEPENEDC